MTFDLFGCIENTLTTREIIGLFPDAKKARLIDALGVWGDLPLTERNLECVPNSYQYDSETGTLMMFVA